MNKNLFAAILLVLSLLCMVSCNSENATVINTAVADSTESTAQQATTVTTKYLDNLPDDLDYDGGTVTFLYREEVSNEFYIEEADGEIVNDAIYDSFRTVEERLNVEIESVLRKGHLAEVRSLYLNNITNAVMAGDALYDWVDLMIGYAPVLAQ